MNEMELKTKMVCMYAHYINAINNATLDEECDAFYYRICGALSFASDIGVITLKERRELTQQAAEVCANRVLELEYVKV